MALPSSNHGKDIQNFIEKSTSAVMSLTQFREDFPVPEKEDTIGIAGCKSVMGYHENRSAHLFVDTLHGGQKHLRGMAVQSSCGFVCQKQPGIVDESHCTGAACFWPPDTWYGYLFRISQIFSFCAISQMLGSTS